MYHSLHFGFGSFEFNAGGTRMHSDFIARYGPLQEERDFVRFCTLQNLQCILISHIIEVDSSTEQLVTYGKKE